MYSDDDDNVPEDEIITTDDIMEVLDEMGLQLDSQEDIDRLMEAVLDIENSSSDESLFMGVEASPQPRPAADTFASPFRPRSRTVAPDTGRSVYFSAMNTMRSGSEDMKISNNPEADFWIAKAYERMSHIYEEIDDLIGPTGKKPSATVRPTQRNSGGEENKENARAPEANRIPPRREPSQTRNVRERVGGAPASTVGSTVASSQLTRTTVPSTATGADKASLRPVIKPDPGRLAYKHDPVKRWELAREEWARLPPPHEKKRLELRWKVREYMLRQEKPTFDPRRPVQPVVHPKDWSPRPYLP